MSRLLRALSDRVLTVGARSVLLLILIVVQLGFGITVLSSDKVKSVSSVTVMVPSNQVVDGSGSASLEGAWAGVQAAAMAWNEDARLALVSAQYDWPLSAPPGGASDLPVGGWLTFVFMRKVDEGAESLSVLVERRSGVVVRKLVRRVGIQPPDGALHLDEWPVTSIAALAAAEAAGGEAFRNACPGARHVTRLALEEAPNGNGAYWVVTYQDVRVPVAPALRVRIDATSGAINAEMPTAAEEDYVDMEACQN